MAVHELESSIANGMLVAYHAERMPDTSAILSQYGDRTFAELNANANRLVRLLESHDVGPGDAIAVVTKNRPEFIEALVATQRSGIRFTPINYHLKGEEIGYIVDNCEAKALIADASLGESVEEAPQHAPNATLRLSVGGDIAGESPCSAVFDVGGIVAEIYVVRGRPGRRGPTEGRPVILNLGTVGRDWIACDLRAGAADKPKRQSQ